MTSEFIDSILSIIEENTADPTLFLGEQKKAAKAFKRATKLMYDFMKSEINSNNDSLPELMIDGFDEEQIWQQIELHNEQVIPSLITDISKILSSKNLTQSSVSSKDEKIHKKLPVEKSQNSQNEEETEEESENEGEGEEVLSEAESAEPSTIKARKPKKRKIESSIVDDKFFKMQELNEYLNEEENKQTKGLKKSENQSDDDSVDLFNSLSENDEDDEEAQNARLVKYADFFDSPESDGESGDRHKNPCQENDSNQEQELDSEGEIFEKPNADQQSSAAKRVKFNLPVDSDYSNESEAESEKEEKKKKVKSSLEQRQERLKQKIEELEEEAIAEKPWQLKGEVSASGRPQNSLLEDYVEVDIVSRPPPVITEQTTLKLEDIIRQRIKDKAWDDVEKKIKPVNTPTEFKKKLIMNQEKSKQSLAEIYEKEYVKQREALNPDQETEVAEPKEHNEIREMMHSLFRKLDALSNFHYTPRLAQPELKIISNIPAINMEEVAPLSTSDATLLAPEEVHAKQRGDLLGKAERTKTDKKRELRKKKKKQRDIQQVKEKREKLKTDSTIRMKRNKESAKVVEKLTKSRNISKMDEQDHKATKSSTAFFTQLQDEVQSQIKANISKKSGKKDKTRVSAIKLKL